MVCVCVCPVCLCVCVSVYMCRDIGCPLYQETVPPTVPLTSEAEKAWCVCVCILAFLIHG